MAKKKKSVKSTRKKTTKKITSKKAPSKSLNAGYYKRRIELISKNFIFFTILFVVSISLYLASSDELYDNLFALFSMFFGAISLAILIAWLILFFRRNIKN